VAHPADGPGASCGPPGQILGLTAADGEAVTMANTFTASKPGTWDFLAVARLGGDAAKMAAAASRHFRRQLTPALMGVG
jgi:hypothetical protein